jgi:predicted glycosyltransferase
MIAFLTQYYRGLGHSQRIKFIAEKTAEFEDVIIIDQLFQPPLDYTVEHVSFLKNYKIPLDSNLFQFIMSSDLINFRIARFIEILETKKIKTLVCEGFPFCRHQFAHEYIRYFEECKKRNIKIIISVRDFPWDEPHDNQLQDWVSYTQNLICKYYAEVVLVHGDEDILPLVADRHRHANSQQIINNIKDKIHYTGYVCDENQSETYIGNSNKIFVSTGLNKEEGVLLFKHIMRIAKDFTEYDFVMPVANRYMSTKYGKKDNLYLVDYIPNLRDKLQYCAAYITYGGYNATTEILKGQIPSIVIPRESGRKIEQFARAYVFEPYSFFKVLNNSEFFKLGETLREVLTNKPNKFTYKLNGASESANVITKIHNG